MPDKLNNNDDNSCKRCGTCCKKGGPSFHIKDKPLIDKGKIPGKYLYTIRKNEPARDNIKNTLSPVDSDIIKIKSKYPPENWTCVFYEKAGCSIYRDRPSECKALKCWDTEEIEKTYSKDRLERKDLFSNIEGLWDLIIDHQNRCSYKTIKKLADIIKDKEAQKKLTELIQFDIYIRKLVEERSGMDSGMMDFLFGRKLVHTIKMFGLTIQQKDNEFIISSSVAIPKSE